MTETEVTNGESENEVEIWEAHRVAAEIAYRGTEDSPPVLAGTHFMGIYDDIFYGLVERLTGERMLPTAPDWYGILENYIQESDTIKVTEEPGDPLNQRDAVLTVTVTRADLREVIEVAAPASIEGEGAEI